MESSVKQIKIADYIISVAINKPDKYSCCLIIANGAGGNMHSPFISRFHKRFCAENIMTVKFNFHYQEIGKKFPDSNKKCRETYLGLIDYLVNHEHLDIKSIIPGGKSMGGRIATQIAGQIESPKLIIFGYPLHPPGKPDKLRDEHLYDLNKNILIFQGENDAFGNKAEITPIVRKLKNTRFVFISDADHSFKLPKHSSLTEENVNELIIKEVKDFLD